MPDPTFECGTILAGFGPGNFFDGDTGDRVWGGDDDWDPPFFDFDGIEIPPHGPPPPDIPEEGDYSVVWRCERHPVWKCFPHLVFPNDLLLFHQKAY